MFIFRSLTGFFLVCTQYCVMVFLFTCHPANLICPRKFPARPPFATSCAVPLPLVVLLVYVTPHLYARIEFEYGPCETYWRLSLRLCEVWSAGFCQCGRYSLRVSGCIQSLKWTIIMITAVSDIDIAAFELWLALPGPRPGGRGPGKWTTLGTCSLKPGLTFLQLKVGPCSSRLRYM